MNKLLSVMALTMLLVGCKTIETKHTTTFIAPPSALLVECAPTEPPAVDKYMAADWSAKEELLTTYANAQTLALAKCNVDKRSLQQWVNDQKAIYER